MECDLLIQRAKILPQPGQTTMIDQGFVAVIAGKICALGSMSELAGITARQQIDASNCLVLPGLVNGHVHGAMTLFRGLADDLPLLEWLEGHIFPAEARNVTEEMVYWCTKLAAAEMLLAGTCLAADSYFCMAGAARAYQESGLRAVAAHGVIDFPAPGVPDPDKKLEVVREFCQQWHHDPLVTPAIFAHSPYTCGPDTLRDTRELARQLGVDFYIHLAETALEGQLIKDNKLSPTAYLDRLGILDEGVVVVHGVWLDDTDIAILGQRGCRLVSCPESNMKLASGIAPLTKLHEQGVPLGLGTDGAASNNNLDMFSEMGMAARLAKVATLNPEALPASQVLAMATNQGAQVLGQPGQGLTVGARADLIVVKLDSPHLTLFYNSDILVYGGRGHDVRDVLVAGRVVVADGQLLTMDLPEIMTQVNHLAKQINQHSRRDEHNQP